MAKFDALARTALGLVTRKGGDAVFSRSSRAGIDPVTQDGTETTSGATLKAVEIPPGKSAEFVIGSLVGRNIIQLYVGRYGQAFAPEPGDLVNWGANTFKVIHATHYDPAADGAVLSVIYAER